jgi:hypothetical protein
MNYLKIRGVRSRVGDPGTYEVTIISKQGPNAWGCLGKSCGHATVEAARSAGAALARRRSIKIEDDPTGSKLRNVEFLDRYGDIDDVPSTKPPKLGRPRRAKSASDDRVTIRLTTQERAKYEAAAARADLTLGEWLRAAAELAIARGSTR